MFDMKDPDNKKAFITGLVVGEELNKKDEPKRNTEPAGEGSAIGTLIGFLISAIVIVVAYIVLMK